MRKGLLAILILGAIWISAAERGVHAQTAGSTLPPVMCYQVLHTSCATSVGTTTYAFASDGLWISLNGAPFAQVQIGPVVAGVTSLNGKSGALTISTVTSTVPAVSIAVN